MRKQIDDMARQLLGGAADTVCLQLARTVAEGQVALARVRSTRVALIESNRAATPSTLGLDSSSEAIRTVLSDLLKLDRYERRAIARRDAAVRELLKRNCICQEEVLQEARS
jgi:hypothetical protein